MKKLTRKTWLAIVIFSLFGQVAWTIENMVLNQFIAQELGANQFDIALMVSLSAVVATLTTLFLGALSDKLGKRKIFMSIGYLIWGVTIICFSLIKKENLESWFGIVNGAALGVGLVITFDCIMSFFG
ncbi:MAG: MFS transporter, partial [Acholeplasmatales bacterium]|nr:MFS transporter [Acholeplasmatales bacterium]